VVGIRRIGFVRSNGGEKEERICVRLSYLFDSDAPAPCVEQKSNFPMRQEMLHQKENAERGIGKEKARFVDRGDTARGGSKRKKREDRHGIRT